MPAQLSFVYPSDIQPANDRARLLLAGCAHYGKSDLPLFTAGYNELCRVDLAGARVLEVCCGVGELARELARGFPQAEVIALDRYPDSGRAVVEAKLHNLRFHQGDALRLPEFPDSSFDLIYGQATLHHLAHDTFALRDEYVRLLKPGGRVVFIYEPLGHNPLFAMIRAWRIARVHMQDESNVVFPQLEEIARGFRGCQVQLFNLLGYPFKFAGRFLGEGAIRCVHRLDGSLMRRWPRLGPLAANFNVIFTK